jgi:tetratricopeptide (TPR) repeat protein
VEKARARSGLLRLAASRAGIAFALAALTLAVFVQVRHHDFVDYDDYVYVGHNPHVTSGLSWQNAKEAFSVPYKVQWTPLSRISLQLDYEIHGDDATGYLLTNVALHTLSTLLLFFALANMTGAVWRSAFVAAVFAVHPLHVESVAWTSERKDVLSALFFMLTLAAYARYTARKASKVGYALVLVCLTLGLIAKATLVTLPCVLLLLDYWPLARLGRRAVLEKLPLLVPAAAVGAATLLIQHSAGATWYGETIAFDARVLNAVDSYLIYIAKSFWPSGLAAFYPHPFDTLQPAQVAAEGILLLAVTGVVVALRRSRPYLLVGWFWYVGMLVPVIGLVQVGLQARADRYMYLPLIGLSIALAWGAADLAQGRLARRVLAVGGAGALMALAIAAWVQVGYWRDSFTLFEHALAVTPDSHDAHKQLAVLHLRAENFEQAEHHYTRVFELAPETGRSDLVRFNIGMGHALSKRHEFDAALAHYREAVRVDPNNGRANGILGLVLVYSDRAFEARPYLEVALRGQPGSAQLQAAMASVASAEGNLAEAVAYNREAIRLKPKLRPARNNLAWLLATSPDESLRDPAEALQIAEGLRDEVEEPGADLLDTLAAAYAAAGRFEEAVRSAEQAVVLAEAEGDLAMAATFRKRLSNYRSREPYVEPVTR